MKKIRAQETRKSEFEEQSLNNILHQTLVDEQEKNFSLRQLVSKLKDELHQPKWKGRGELKQSLRRLNEALNEKNFITVHLPTLSSEQKFSLRNFKQWERDMQSAVKATKSLYMKQFKEQIILERCDEVDPVLLMAYYNYIQHLRMLREFVEMKQKTDDFLLNLKSSVADIKREILCIEELL